MTHTVTQQGASRVDGDREAEQAAVGAMLQSAQAIEETRFLRADAVTHPATRLLLETIRGMAAENRPVDQQTVTSELRAAGRLTEAGGAAWIRRCVEASRFPQSAREYAKVVQDAHDRNALRSKLAAALSSSTDVDAAVVAARDAIDSIAARRPSRSDTGESIKDIASAYMEGFTSPEAVAAERIPHPPELPTLQRHTNGRRRGDGVLIAGYSYDGKTILALQMAIADAIRGYNVGWFPQEMTTRDMFERMIKMITGLPAFVIEDRDMQYQAQIAAAVKTIQDLPITLYPPVNWTPERMDLEQERHHYDSLYLDHLNHTATEVGDLERFATDFYNIGKRTNATTVLLQQLTPGLSGEADRPSKINLRGTKATFDKSDLVLLLHREREYGARTNKATLNIAKFRRAKQRVLDVTLDDRQLVFREPGA